MQFLLVGCHVMSMLDFIIIFIVAVFLVRGIWIGFVRQLASIAALVLGFVIAGRYYGESAAFVTPFVRDPQLGFFIAYLVLFAAAFGAVILIGFFLRQVVTLSLLGWFDRMLGGVFGIAKAALLSCLLVMSAGLVVSGSHPFFRSSSLYPYLENGSQLLLILIRDRQLRDSLWPRPPAIVPLSDSPVQTGKPVRSGTE
ncbi:MAG: CvpA family protein [Thermodesulfobacteriota bacterium]